MKNKGQKIVYEVPSMEILTLMERYDTVMEQINVLVYDINLKLHKVYINDSCGSNSKDYVSNKKKWLELLKLSTIHPEDRIKFKEFLRNHYMEKKESSIIYRRLHSSGNYIWLKNSRRNYHDNKGQLERVVGTEQEITYQMESSDLSGKSSELDPVTGIYSRGKFEVKAQELFKTWNGAPLAVIVFDLDNFKVMNDLHGMAEGDRILAHIGQVLSEQISMPGIYGRLYADHFAIIIPYIKDDELVLKIKEIEKSILTYGLRLEGTLSFGICKWDGGNTSVGNLCDYASLAKKSIKGNILHLYSFYDETIREKILYEQRIESDMMDALKNGEFEMYLQPKISLSNSKVVGAEALVRWNHPQLGLIFPDKFIPIFEKNGFVIQMDYYIWEQAISTIQKWITNGITNLPISINVSRQHILDSNLVEIVKSLASRYGVPTYLIELELTETVCFDNFEKLSKIIQELRSHGFILSIDDFGSGYTSLNMITDLPIDVIKFDKKFVKEISSSNRGKTVIGHIIAMAKQLGMKAVAEGIEDEGQAVFMRDAGCDYAQGYYYSRPLQVHNFETFTFDNN